MDYSQSDDIDSNTQNWQTAPIDEPLISLNQVDETPIINTTNADFHPTSIPPTTPTTTAKTQNWETSNPVVDSVTNKTKEEFKKGQQQVEDIATKTKRILKQNCKFELSNSVDTSRVLDPFLCHLIICFCYSNVRKMIAKN